MIMYNIIIIIFPHKWRKCATVFCFFNPADKIGYERLT